MWTPRAEIFHIDLMDNTETRRNDAAGFRYVHQVNMEYLARGVHKRNDAEAGDVYYPDTLVGTDSHTTMINGVGVVGWGVGGIEAKRACSDSRFIS